jgi:hypothetical protein
MPRLPRHFRASFIERLVVFLITIAAAATAAMVLYALGHNEMGIPRHSIMIASFAAAGFLIVVCAAMTFMRNTR